MQKIMHNPIYGFRGHLLSLMAKGKTAHMNKSTLLAATAALAVAMSPAASTANNCATVTGTPTADDQGASLHSGYYGQDLTNSFSVGLWAKNLTAVWHLYVFSTQHVNLYCPNGSEKLNFSVIQEDATTGTNATVTAARADARAAILDDGDWHFYCCTFHYDAADPSASFQRLYIDGTLETEVAGAAILGPAATPNSSRKFTIGGQWDTDGGNWANWKARSGSVSEVTVWSRALSAAEVMSLATHRAGGFESGLAVYWPLTGTTLEDGGNWARGGVSATVYQSQNRLSFAMADDDTLPIGNFRCVASPAWVAEHGYAAPPNATFRSWDDPATNIQQALDAAYKYETILLMPGTHLLSSQIDITKPNITFTRGPGDGEAVIDAQGRCRHFRSQTGNSGTSFVFDGLTFTNGSDTDGGSMYFSNRAGTIRNCVFRNNAATGNGGAIYSLTYEGIRSVVSNCVFYGNTAVSYGGAIYTQQNAESASDKCIVVDCVITNNSATRGGGINAVRCIEIDRCRLADNKAVTGNSKRGGAICAGIYSQIRNCAFIGTSSASYGHCIELLGRDASVSNCKFIGLSMTGGFGAIHTGSSGCLVSDCVFTNATWNDTALFLPEGSSASLTVRQCLIGENLGVGRVVDDFGGKMRFENCTILPTPLDRKPSNQSGQNVLVNCILPNADIASSGSFANILTNCLVKSVSGGTQDSGVMTGNPKFADAANGDYRLAATSSCREKGLTLDWMTAGSTDLAGEPRLVNLLGKAFVADARPDLGCYECQEVGIQPTVMTFR